MAAWDNVQLPQPPSLRPPTVDFSPLGQLGDAYYKGQEQQRNIAIRNAFAEGFPTDDKGQPDFRQAANKLFQLGGYDQGVSLLKMAYGQQGVEALQNARPPTDMTGGGGATYTPQPVTGPAGPAAPAAAQPQLTSEEMITPRQVAVANGPGGAAAVAPNVPTQVAQNAPGIPGVPAQGQAPTIPQAPPQGPTPAEPAGVSAAARLVPPQFKSNPGFFADQLDAAANKIDNAIALGGIGGVDLKPAAERAKAYRAQAAEIRKALAPTETEKDIASGATRAKIQVESAQKRGEATYAGIGQVAKLWETGGGKTYNNLAKSILNQPEMYTGFGSGPITDLKKVQAMFGGDQRGAQYAEALKKLTAADVLNTINATRAEASEGSQNSNAGRIFSQQVEQAEKTALNTESTLAGNRFLAELKGRMGEYAVRVRNMAADYYSKNKTIDEGFDRLVEADLKKNPLFTPAEMKNPSLIGAPTSPYDNVGQTAAWAQKMGLKPGDAIRTPSGRLIAVPGVAPNVTPNVAPSVAPRGP